MKFVIVGNGVAAVRAAESIRRREPGGTITIISDEPYLAYSRPLTSYLIGGKVSEAQMEYRSRAFYDRNGIETRLGERVDNVDAAARQVILESGERIPYDALLLATGATPVIPDIPGVELAGVSGLRTMNDARAIAARAETSRRALVLGGGFCGMTAAKGLRNRGLEVTVVVSSDRLLSQMLDLEGATMIRERLEAEGFEVLTGCDVAAIHGNGGIERVELTNGSIVEAQLMVIGKGVRANTGLAESAGVEVGRGVRVDAGMRTSDPRIYAAGDVAEAYDPLFHSHRVVAIWPNAARQGGAAGANMAGDQVTLSGAVGMNSLEFYGLPMVAVGSVRADENTETLERRENGYYRKVVLDGDRIVGAVFIGQVDRSGIVTGLIRDGYPARPFARRILEPDFGFMNLPESYRRERLANA